MANNNFVKINGEYVKFYATTNSSLPNVLKNTGALIVTKNEDDRKSLYLANHFIASGIGFNDEDITKYYEEWAGHKYSQEKRDLTYVLDSLTGSIYNTNRKISDYVLTEGGVINHTFLTTYKDAINADYAVTVDEFAKMQKKPKYDDLKIIDFWSYITFGFSNDILNDESSLKFEKSYCNVFGEELKYDIPYGAYLGRLHMYLKTLDGSTSGFVTDMNDPSISNENINGESITTYEFYSDLAEFGNVNVLENISLNCAGTVRYKNYPWLLEKQGLVSYESGIDPYSINVKINYNKRPYVRYVFNEVNDIRKIYKDWLITIPEGEISNIKVDVTNDCNCSYWQISSSESPVRVFVEHKDERNNHISNYIYDITGDMHELKHRDMEDNSYILNNYMYSNVKNNESLECVNYVLDYKLKENDQITIYFKDNKNINDIINYVEYVNGVNTFEKSSYYVLSSEYNSTHWMSVEDLKYLL